MDDSPARNLARNLRALRGERNLTQKQLAELTGVKRPTLAVLETGSGNPTLAVLAKVAKGLQTTIEALIAPAPGVLVTRAADVAETAVAGVSRRPLALGVPKAVRGEFLRLSGLTMAEPSLAGTVAHVACLRGSIKLLVDGEHYTLSPGDLASFRADQAWSIQGDGAEATLVVLPTG